MLTWASMWSLHMNGRTDAAAAAAAPDDECFIMIATASSAADAPLKRKTARADGDTCITLRAHASICSCCKLLTCGRRPIIRKKTPEAKTLVSPPPLCQADELLVAAAHAAERRATTSGTAAGGRRGMTSSNTGDDCNTSTALLVAELCP